MKTSLKAAFLVIALVSIGAGVATAQDAPKVAKAATEKLPALNQDEVMDKADVTQLGGVSDADIESLEVAAVQPVVFQDQQDTTDATAALSTVASLKENADEAKALESDYSQISLPEGKSEEEGLGFAGKSRKLDIVSLKYGYMLASLPLVKALSPKKYNSVFATAKKLTGLKKFYSPSTQVQLTTYINNAANGKFNGRDYANLLSATTRDMAQGASADKQRVHGYLLVGLWAGYARMVAASGKGSAKMANIGDALRKMLLKDASFGGSDIKLAGQVKIIAGNIKGTPNKANIKSAIAQMMATKADK